MKKIKLPRKRKKRMIKERGHTAYMSMQIANEIMAEDTTKEREAYFHKFPNKTGIVSGKFIVYSYY